MGTGLHSFVPDQEKARLIVVVRGVVSLPLLLHKLPAQDTVDACGCAPSAGWPKSLKTAQLGDGEQQTKSGARVQ